MMKPFLILQLRPETAASDDEYMAFLEFGGLDIKHTKRLRIEKHGLPKIQLKDYSGVIIGGGPFNISDPEEHKSAEQKKVEQDLHHLLDEIIDRDFPFLGCCYGIGILAKHLGAKVSKEKYSESAGAVTIKLSKAASNDPLTTGLQTEFRAFVGHKEAVQELPSGATLLASSKTCPIQLFKTKQNIYATQFHPELDSHGLEVRINIYKHAGYFPPEDAEKLIAAAHQEVVFVPEELLKRFVERYRQ